MWDFKGHPRGKLKTINCSMNYLLQFIESRDCTFLISTKSKKKLQSIPRHLMRKKKYVVQGVLVAEQLKKLYLTESASFEDTKGQ